MSFWIAKQLTYLGEWLLDLASAISVDGYEAAQPKPIKTIQEMLDE